MSSFQSRQATPTPSGSQNVPYTNGQNRRSAGAPGGGQFTSTSHGESALSLRAHPASMVPAIIRIPRQVFAAVRTLVSDTIRKVRGRSMEPKVSDRISPYSASTKLSVTGLVKVTAANAGAAASAAATNNHPSGCQAAPRSLTSAT